jgi:hypothetical protein
VDEDGSDFECAIRACGVAACAAWGDHPEEPVVPEIRLLRALWRVADPDERTVLASAMARAFAREHDLW